MTIQLLALSILGPHPQEQQVLGFLSRTGPTFYGQYLGTAEVTCICDLPREND